MNNSIRAFAVAAMLLGAATQAQALDGMSLEVGNGDDTDVVRVAGQWDWGSKWFEEGDWYLTGYWDLSLAYWDGEKSKSITEVGITPVFRLTTHDSSGAQPYAEFAIGAHLMSQTRINDRQMSTMFQFGDHVGFGARFGDKGEFDLGYRFQHLSNASIKKPNPGINFHLLRLGYHFN
jgi:hypothetical protein